MRDIVHAGSLIAVAPLIVGMAASSYRTRAARWLLIWCAVNLAWNIIGNALGSSGKNNLWIEHWSIPLELLLLGGAVAAMLPQSMRRVVWSVAAGGIALVVGIAAFVEDLRQFPALTGTIRSILVSAGAAYLLLTRAAIAESGWWRDGGRLAAAGLLIIFLPNLMIELAFRQLMSQESDIVMTVLGVRAMFWIAGYSLIALGMRWHSTMPPSGSALSPLRFSPSPS